VSENFLEEPELVSKLNRAELAALLPRISTLQATVFTALLAGDSRKTLGADEIADKIGVKRTWLFRNLKKLGFIKRVSRKTLVANEADVLKFVAQRNARKRR